MNIADTTLTICPVAGATVRQLPQQALKLGDPSDLRVGVQVCGKEEQEPEEVHLVLQLRDERLPQHADQAAAEGLDLLLHVHHGDIVSLLGLGLDSFDY